MFRSVSTSRVSDDTYYSIYSHSPTSKAVSPALRALALEANELPQPESSPFSTLKKDKLGRARFSEKSVHIIPLILLVCALVLWLFSNPDINMSIKNDLVAAKFKRKAVERDVDTIQIEGSQAEGDFGISKHEESKKLATTLRPRRKYAFSTLGLLTSQDYFPNRLRIHTAKVFGRPETVHFQVGRGPK
ncbi:hypothetical protein L1987_35365 [Smallanthus sonchifolius]|uniref:Uncharacterized protein n=1 Tax=Smallanthus sonchifolius TaxID=185202 RepID=A0ACB9HXK4_9ASTR|nr:hypothetical protein L1987_35365 [Smallanthus sonchifolius]